MNLGICMILILGLGACTKKNSSGGATRPAVSTGGNNPQQNGKPNPSSMPPVVVTVASPTPIPTPTPLPPVFIGALQTQSTIGKINLNIYTQNLPADYNLQNKIGTFHFDRSNTIYSETDFGPRPKVTLTSSGSYPVFFDGFYPEGVRFGTVISIEDSQILVKKPWKKEQKMVTASWLVCTQYQYERTPMICNTIKNLPSPWSLLAPPSGMDCMSWRNDIGCRPEDGRCEIPTSVYTHEVSEDEVKNAPITFSCSGPRVPHYEYTKVTDRDEVTNAEVIFDLKKPAELIPNGTTVFRNQNGKPFTITEEKWSFGVIPEFI